jgi:cell division protein FtsB
MYAPQPTPPSDSKPRPSAVRSRRPVRATHRAITVEVGIKITVNLCLVAASGVALTRLIPHTLRQQTQLQALQAEVTYLDRQVADLRLEFNAYFDAAQIERLAQEDGQWLKPNQRRVVWTRPQPASDGRQMATTPAP